eukprot:TRINITY_DN11603_c0_g1_i2.p1 TRINITY_DN11603_c0_g1~~TRINITY_DN11603_c0_g1_i2.p1  ORF type:complete len:581 (+),score=154.10 TRINITY_DN11603_c0_g1_i2:46-1788(+)
MCIRDRNSIRYCGAHRIGHGVALQDAPDLLQYVVDRRVPIEVCITSNVQTKGVRSLAEHPARMFYDKGVVVVPCTDNCTMSDTTLSKEYYLWQEHLNFTPIEMLYLIDNGFKAAFLPANLKDRLRAEALNEALEIMKSEGVDISSFVETDYFHNIGISSSDSTVHYWRIPPAIASSSSARPTTKESYSEALLKLLKDFPKVDLNCRFDGSVSVDFISKELKTIDFEQLISTIPVLHPLLPTLREFYDARESPDVLRQKLLTHHAAAKKLMRKLLQTRDQLTRAVHDILSQAAAERVVYMELSVSPSRHTHGGLEAEEVLKTIIEAKTKAESELSIKVNLVLFSDYVTDSPIDFHKTAELTVRYNKSGVVGFAALGESDLAQEDLKYFQSTFNYLKDNLMHCLFSAGITNENTITPAIHLGGATRLSGAFTVHRSPRILSYLADHHIAVEVSTTSTKYISSTSEIVEFTDAHPIRWLFDNHVPVVITSSHFTLSPHTRTETIHQLAIASNFSIAELLELLSVGFRNNFMSHQEREIQFKNVWVEMVQKLKQFGFTHIFKKRYFPPAFNPDSVPSSPVSAHK